MEAPVSEKVKIISEPLQYRQLINPNAPANRILEPNRIPVHPKVYTSPDLFTLTFASHVAQAVPASILKDIIAIEEALEIKLNIDSQQHQITQGSTTLQFEDFQITANPNSRFVEVSYLPSSNIALDTRAGHQVTFRPTKSYPMPLEKLIDYGFQPDNFDSYLPTWYIHNLSHVGLPGFLYFRNFAIMFNNLGLQKLGE